MKFTKTLASVAAAALAVSALSVSSFADWKGANGDGNLVFNVADILPEDVNIADVYGVSVVFTDASAAVLAEGAGGGFIFSTASNNWNQLQWCNGCGEDEAHDIQLDTETNSITRMETAPFFTAEDISGEEGTYGQIALSQWWGGDIAYSTINFLGADASVIGTYEYVPEIKVSKAQDYVDLEAERIDIGLEAQFDKTTGIDEWPSLPKTTFKADGSDVTLTYDFSDYGAPVKFGGNYIALATALEWANYDENPDMYSAENVAIKSIKFDGVEYGDYTKLAVNNEAGNGTALRITLMNEWNDNFKGGNAPLSGVELPAFTTFEITIAVTEAVEEEPTDEPTDVPTVNPGETTEPVEPGETETPSEILPGESSGTPINPDSGVAVTVIPAALAAAALATTGIVLKKRSK